MRSSARGAARNCAAPGWFPTRRSHSIAAESRAQGTLDAPLKEYADLFVTLGEQAVRQSRLASPLPCVAHWLAGSDQVIVAVSRAGSERRTGTERHAATHRRPRPDWSWRCPMGNGHARAATRASLLTSWRSTERECVFVSCCRARPMTRGGCSRPTSRCGPPSRGATGRHASSTVLR